MTGGLAVAGELLLPTHGAVGLLRAGARCCSRFPAVLLGDALRHRRGARAARGDCGAQLPGSGAREPSAGVGGDAVRRRPRPRPRRALATLRAPGHRPGDELILADNSGTAPARAGGVQVVRAAGERSPAHARNAGAAPRPRRVDPVPRRRLRGSRRPARALLRAGARRPRSGALAGEIEPAPGRRHARRAVRRGAELPRCRRPPRPPVPAARRRGQPAGAPEAFEALGGFVEGIRAAEDTDFCWRLQQAGWRLELRAGAVVAHRYRTTLRALGRQWRALRRRAGRGWPTATRTSTRSRPLMRRAAPRRCAPACGARPPDARHAAADAGTPPAGESPGSALIDAWLAVQELIGFTQSNRARRR